MRNMKTIFDKTTRDELINRVNKLNENSRAQWGKMTIYQMLKHCTLWEEMALGKKAYKQVFLGRLFGKMALKGLTKDETPMGRNVPTAPGFKITGDGNVLLEKTKWAALLAEYAGAPDTGIIHPFFGYITKEQIGYLAYKHADHHLRQFNA